MVLADTLCVRIRTVSRALRDELLRISLDSFGHPTNRMTLVGPALEDPSMATSFLRGILPCLLAAGLGAALLTAAAEAQAPKKPEAPTIPSFLGTLTEVKKKGMQTILTITPELGGTEPFELPVTPMLGMAIEAKGDSGFLREKQFVSATGFVNNGTFLVEKWTVHVGPATKKMQPGTRPLPDTDENGEKKPQAGVKFVEVTAQLMSINPDKDDASRSVAVLKIGGPKGTPASFDSKAPITVRSSDPAMLKEGSEMEYYPVAGGNPKRPKVVAVKVKLAEALKSEEFFAAEEESRAKK